MKMILKVLINIYFNSRYLRMLGHHKNTSLKCQKSNGVEKLDTPNIR
nr:MAG TPA: hypothetical protein [Caudoviricetes sp.]